MKSAWRYHGMKIFEYYTIFFTARDKCTTLFFSKWTQLYSKVLKWDQVKDKSNPMKHHR